MASTDTKDFGPATANHSRRNFGRVRRRGTANGCWWAAVYGWWRLAWRAGGGPRLHCPFDASWLKQWSPPQTAVGSGGRWVPLVWAVGGGGRRVGGKLSCRRRRERQGRALHSSVGGARARAGCSLLVVVGAPADRPAAVRAVLMVQRAPLGRLPRARSGARPQDPKPHRPNKAGAALPGAWRPLPGAGCLLPGACASHKHAFQIRAFPAHVRASLRLARIWTGGDPLDWLRIGPPSDTCMGRRRRGRGGRGEGKGKEGRMREGKKRKGGKERGTWPRAGLCRFRANAG